ncbi:MAG: PHP domain-containing protein [Oscillospiraceae bacterium]|nr:PHP domain-containing protein [Oscillospiraceae bacterium]
MWMDLHTHTTCSDGQYTPEELVIRAGKLGIRALAITDHDAVSGTERGRIAAKVFPELEVFSGIEMSAKENPQLHILGYGIDGNHPDLQVYIEKNKRLRLGRRERMLAFLQEKGVPLTLEEVMAANDGRSSGRPHFAKAMLKKGIVSSVEEAFDRYLATPEYLQRVERPKPTAVESIQIIRKAGGVAVLAHPAKLKLEPSAFLELLSVLCEAGLQGIEAYYSTHSRKEMAWYCEIAKQYGLFCTCGSDFHGEIIKPEIALGTGKNGSLLLPEELKRELLQNFKHALSNRSNRV